MSDNATDPIPPARRLVRPRISEDLRTVQPTDEVRPTEGTRRISFGGCMQRLESRIAMTLSRDVLYFDEPLPFTFLCYLDAFSNKPPRAASPLERVALNLDKLSSRHWRHIRFVVDNMALSHLILVSSSPRLRRYALAVPFDEWGFRYVPEKTFEAEEPRLYRSGLDAVKIIGGAADVDIRYKFVYMGEEQEEINREG